MYTYTIFHHNLLFSSIPSSHYGYIANKIYSSILLLATDGFPVGIEFNGWTLEVLNQICPEYVSTLRRLITEGAVEFIGSSYTQTIFPLIPYKSNFKNLKLGIDIYHNLLDIKPSIALINEQVYSEGAVNLLNELGYDGFLFDWRNATKGWEHNRWVSKIAKWHPAKNEGLKVLWTDSVNTQKFQRAVWGDIDIDDYLFFVEQSLKQKPFAFPLYGGDAEVFEYIPGTLNFSKNGRDFERMLTILKILRDDMGLEFLLPSEILDRAERFPEVEIASPDYSIRTKKQDKYNVTRWAVTGRDAVRMNTQCFQVYDKIKNEDDPYLWRELSFLWSSDFRTNTTDEKYLEFRNRMGHILEIAHEKYKSEKSNIRGSESILCSYHVQEEGRYFNIDTPTTALSLIKNKGLSLSKLTFKKMSESPVVGTIPHGYYEDISYAADFYSFHTIVITQRGEQITDLNASCEVEVIATDDKIIIRNKDPMELGLFSLIKEYHLSPELEVRYKLYFYDLYPVSVRLGIVTLIPDSFSVDSLYYETHNGGRDPERFYVKGYTIKQDMAVNQVVTSHGCLGATEGYLVVGDANKSIIIFTDRTKLYSVPMLRFQQVDNSFFFRVYHSICERDDVASLFFRGYNEVVVKIKPGESKSED